MEWDVKRWPNFSLRELSCKCSECSPSFIVFETFLDRLQNLRGSYERPMIISSGYRCPKYNARISNTGLRGPHTTGRAVDVKVFGPRAYELVQHAISLGFTGIGVSQNGSYEGRFIHLDDLPNGEHPRPWVWSY